MAPTKQRSINASRLHFALWFAATAGVLFAVYTFPYRENGISESGFTAYLSWYARLTGHVLALFDPSVTVHGQDIVGRYNLRIVKSCDAMEANILFVAAVLAFPESWKKRVIGVALGVPLLVAINVLRICSLYYIGIHVPKAFEFFHLELWPLVLIGSGLAAFLFWASWAADRGLIARSTHAAR
ncbi:MAG TPA: exosortase H [Polyangiaceae bacterium]